VGLVVESTYNWYWLVDALLEAGYRVHLANTAAIVQYSGLKYSDDDSDARWLAKLLRLGLLPEGYIYPKAERAVRDLLRRHFADQGGSLRRLAEALHVEVDEARLVTGVAVESLKRGL
jgi:transposase